jgi:hypothetical protein
MPPPHIANWLSQALGTYVYSAESHRAVSSALDTYSSLKVKTDQYSSSRLPFHLVYLSTLTHLPFRAYDRYSTR